MIWHRLFIFGGMCCRIGFAVFTRNTIAQVSTGGSLTLRSLLSLLEEELECAALLGGQLLFECVDPGLDGLRLGERECGTDGFESVIDGDGYSGGELASGARGGRFTGHAALARVTRLAPRAVVVPVGCQNCNGLHGTF